MKHLEFRRKYLNLLKSGKKRSTIRKKAHVKTGDHVLVHCGGMIIGKAKIISIKKIRIDSIDDEIARMEGFSSRSELVKELRNYYSSSESYLIEFEFEELEKPVTPREMYYENRDLSDVAKRALDFPDLNQNEKKIIELFLKTGSIRKTAFRLGGISKRGIVRDALRKAVEIVKKYERENI